MSDPSLSDIDFKNKMAWVTQVLSELPLIWIQYQYHEFTMNLSISWIDFSLTETNFRIFNVETIGWTI